MACFAAAGGQDQADVLEVLREAGFDGEIVVEHFFALVVHDARVGGAGFEDFEGVGGGDFAGVGEGEGFGEDGAVQSEREIDDEFHARAGAIGPR